MTGEQIKLWYEGKQLWNEEVKKIMDKSKYYKLAIKTYELIKEYSEIGEDYSLLQRTYNELIEDYKLDLQKIKYIDNKTFELYIWK